MKDIRLRYAPSPTGHLHIGGARTAIFNYLFAKHYNGKFIVRIEDTDLERNINEGIASQLDNLRWLQLEIDETIDSEGPYAPYRQIERLEIYQKYANQLLDNKLAYYCYCSLEELEQVKIKQLNQKQMLHYIGNCWKLSEKEIAIKKKNNPTPTIRIRILSNKIYKINDLIREEVVFHSKDISDFVIMKANRIPTYNFAVVIDDYLMKISHVLRGEEHLSNTPKQLIIYEAFNWNTPIFGHLTLITNEFGKKLSKRDESIIQFISQYRDQGYLPEAIFNFLVFLGWTAVTTQELYSIKELINIFDETRFSKASGRFDVAKLNWFNEQYIKQLDVEKYWNLCYPFLEKNYDLSKHPLEWWKELVLMYQPQLKFGAEIIDLIAWFLLPNKLENVALQYIKENNMKNVILVFKKLISEVKEWNHSNITEVINDVKKKFNIKGQLLFKTIRIASSLSIEGLQLVKTIEFLGQKKVLENINKLLKFI